MAEGGFKEFLAGLLDAFRTGAQGTWDALSDDVTDIKEGNLPHNISRDIPKMLSMIGQPSINPVIPALQYTRYLPGPEGENQFIIKTADKLYPGGDTIAMAIRNGGFGKLMAQLLAAQEGPKQ